jgi:WhiB family transcriptional regulator, redox-sensing transcriptional regulator
MTPPDWHQHRACAGHPDAGRIFFPDRTPIYERDTDGQLQYTGFAAGKGDNHGRQAKAICQGCPVRTQCLTTAVETNEQDGIYGGAGGVRRRWLRKAWVADGRRPGPNWAAALAQHFANLDGAPGAVNVNGPSATHGLAATYAKGCECSDCCLAVGIRGMAARGPTVGRPFTPTVDDLFTGLPTIDWSEAA